MLYNFLMIKHVLHGSEMPPKIELVQEMINKHAVTSLSMCKRRQCGWHSMTPVTWRWKDQAFAQSKENNKTRAKNAVTQNRDCWAKQAQQKTKQVMHKDVKTTANHVNDE